MHLGTPQNLPGLPYLSSAFTLAILQYAANEGLLRQREVIFSLHIVQQPTACSVYRCFSRPACFLGTLTTYIVLLLPYKAIKAIKAFLNTRYSSVLGWSLDADNFLVDQDTFKFLRQALRYEVGMSLDTPDSNHDFKNKLDNVGKKLNNGWTSNVINLLKITLVLKNIAPNLDYESSVYGESFGLALYQFQTDAGILDAVGDQGFKSYEIIALFSDYGFKPVPATDAKARELGQFLNSYVIKQGIASIIGLTRTDGLVYNFGDYSPLIVAQLQRENQLTVTGKLTEQNCPAYDETKDSIQHPVAEVLYLRGYLDNIPQDYFNQDNYHYALSYFEQNNGFPINTDTLTISQMLILFSTKQDNAISSLSIKQTAQDLINQLAGKTDINMDWNQEVYLGKMNIPLITGELKVDMHAELDLNAKIKHEDGFNSDKTTYTVNIKNNKFDSITSSDETANKVKDILTKPMEKPVAKAKITAGKMSITIEDSNWTGDCTITYTLEFDVIDNKNCSSKITLTIKANLSYQDFLKVVVETAKPEAQPMYQNLIYGMYPTNPAPEYGIDPDNEGLNLYVFGQLQTMNEMNIHASYPKFNLQGLAQFNSNIANILNDLNNNLANSLSQSAYLVNNYQCELALICVFAATVCVMLA